MPIRRLNVVPVSLAARWEAMAVLVVGTVAHQDLVSQSCFRLGSGCELLLGNLPRVGLGALVHHRHHR